MHEPRDDTQRPFESGFVGEGLPGASQSPSIDTTAGVEAIQRFSKKQKLIAALAGGALLAGGAFGLGLAANSGEKPAEAPANTSEPVDPVEPAPIEEPVEEEPTNGETLPFSGEVLVQELTVEQMDALSIEEFAKLPYGDRFAYTREKVSALPVTTVDQDLGFTDASFIPGYFWRSNGIGEADKLSGAKMASSMLYYTTNLQTGEVSDGYQSIINAVQSSAEGEYAGNTLVFVESGLPQSGTDRNGEPIDYVNVTYYSADVHSGERLGPDKTAQAIRTRVQLLNGETVVTYPMGYTIDGKQSPVEGGTY